MESAGARGVRVDVGETSNPAQYKHNKGGTLLPWRMKNAAGLQLRTSAAHSPCSCRESSHEGRQKRNPKVMGPTC